MQFCSAASLMLALGVIIPLMRGWDARAAARTDLEAPDPGVHDRTSAVVASGNPLWAVPLANLHVTRERPVFSASRRPPAPSPVFVAAEPPPPRARPPLAERPPLVLLGTISGGSLHFGIFQGEEVAKTMRLSVGESFDGWTLRAVSAVDARFENEGRVATLLLRPAAQLVMKGDTAQDPDVPVMPLRRKKR